MAKKENTQEDASIHPSVVMGLVGAVVVLLILAGGIWGVGKIISKVRESRNNTQDEQATEQQESTEGEQNSQGEADQENTQGSEENTEQEEAENTEQGTAQTQSSQTETTTASQSQGLKWVANDYKKGDISGSTYTVVRGDTLWEIAEAKYGSGFEWTKIKDANLSKIGFLPDGSRALIFPGQVLVLP